VTLQPIPVRGASPGRRPVTITCWSRCSSA
jgi:hypothetical protein